MKDVSAVKHKSSQSLNEIIIPSRFDKDMKEVLFEEKREKLLLNECARRVESNALSMYACQNINLLSTSHTCVIKKKNISHLSRRLFGSLLIDQICIFI